MQEQIQSALQRVVRNTSTIYFLLLFAWAAEAFGQQGSRYQEPYPKATSKKGLQVEIVEDALKLGIKHAGLNVNLSQLVVPEIDSEGDALPVWTYKGKEYRFRENYLAQLDKRIKSLSDEGILVHLIILAYASDGQDVNRRLLHPDYDDSAPNRLGAFNTETDQGRDWLAATLEFLAERWSRPDQKFGRVVGYIIGNEVNSHWWWSNRGRATMREFADDYLVALRLAHTAIRRQSSWARVYLSLDHHWGIRFPGGEEQQAFPGKDFVDYLANRARESEQGDFDWHVAFHPYPENLFEPRFWRDETAVNRPDTPKITFKNLQVLTDYLRRPALRYEGQPRRVILSEQGFHTPDGPEGEKIQAAAYCYAYRKVENLEGIDAFILHRHVDHPHEGGLKLGLRRYQPEADNPRPKKMIYDVFRQTDTDNWQQACDFALPIIGIEDWEP